jgi:hypothetical protein
VGSLARHPIKAWVHQYRLRTFVETGTFEGDGIAHAADVGGFELLHSVEANPKLAVAARTRFAINPRVFIWLDDSVHGVRAIERGAERPALWWLDAHLPEHYGTHAQRLPLLDEVRVIVAGGCHSRDVFLMDDLRLYARRNFGSGNWGEPEPKAFHLQRIRDLLAPTHELTEDLRDEGYLIALPKEPAC